MARYERSSGYSDFLDKYPGETTSNSFFLNAGLRINNIVGLVTGPRRDRRDRRDQGFFPLWDNLDGMTILDLGCGSSSKQIYDTRKPYLAQLLAAQGAIVYGIDLGEAPQDTGGYTHIQRDLISLVMDGNLAQLDELKGIQFDIVNSSAFIGEGHEASPTLRNMLEDEGYTMDMFTTKLLDQLTQMVVEGGHVLIQEKRYRNTMVNGKLQLEEVK